MTEFQKYSSSFSFHLVLFGKISSRQNPYAYTLLLDEFWKKEQTTTYTWVEKSSCVQLNFCLREQIHRNALFQFIVLSPANIHSLCEQALQSFITTHVTVRLTLFERGNSCLGIGMQELHSTFRTVFTHSAPVAPSSTLGFIAHNFDLHSKGERESLRYHCRLVPCSAFHIRLYNYCMCLEIDICNCLHTYYLVLIRIDAFSDLHLKITQHFGSELGFCCKSAGTLDVRLMGCQDLLENVPGRSKTASVSLPGWSPSEARSSFMSRGNKNKSGSSRTLSKSDDLSS